MEENKTMVEMTEDQKAQFEAFKKEQERKARMESKRELRGELQKLTDEVLVEALSDLKSCSRMLKDCKARVTATLSALVEMRKEINEEEGKKEQDSFTFTDTKGEKRIRIGYNMNDGYLDQVEEGIAKVKAYMSSLAKDDASKELVDLVMSLLARDQKGNLKASRVIRLSQIAEKSDSDEFKEGIQIIRDAYRPTRSKLYIRASEKVKNENGESDWVDIALGLTEV